METALACIAFLINYLKEVAPMKKQENIIFLHFFEFLMECLSLIVQFKFNTDASLLAVFA